MAREPRDGILLTPAGLKDFPERRRLYELGWSDTAIAKATGSTRSTISSWRCDRGLVGERTNCMTKDAEKRRRELYDQKLTDTQIAAIEGVSRPSVRNWRVRRRLPINNPPEAARLLLYQLGYNDVQIARQQGIRSPKAIQIWRNRRGLPHNFLPGKQRPRNDGSTIERIKRAIGKALPAHIAEDAVGDLYLAVLTGKVCLDDIEARARRYGNRVLDQFASRFGPRSLDEELSDDGDGLRMIDLVRDDRSSNWLEEMGATVW